MARRYSRDPQTDRSLRHSVRDGVAVSVQGGSGENYFNAFAVYLKASTGQIALLASLPPLVGSLAQLFSAWLGRRWGNRRDIILLGVRLQAIMWLPIVFLPLLFPEHAMTLFLGCAVVYYAAGSLVSPQWSSLMGDLVPARKRGRFFALRNRLSSVTHFAALVSAGLTLHLFAESQLAYLGFMAIFVVAAVGRLVSAWNLEKMHDPPGKTAALEMPTNTALWQRLRASPLVRFSMFFAAMQASVAVASPFFALYTLRDLHYSYLQFMAGTGASMLMQFLTLSAWGRISDTYGNRFVLTVTGTAIPLVPVLWMFSTDFSYLLVVQAASGAVWCGFTLAAGNFLYDLVPAHKRVTYMAYHNVFANSGIFVGALIGGWIAATMSPEVHVSDVTLSVPSTLVWVFFFSFVARAVTAWLLLPQVPDAGVHKTFNVTNALRVIRPSYLTHALDAMARVRARAGAVLTR